MADSNDRPKVGPADPETRRRLLREKLDEPTGSTGTVKPPPPKPKPKKKGTLETVKDLLDPSKPRERTVGGEPTTVMEAVDKGVAMGDEENKVKRK